MDHALLAQRQAEATIFYDLPADITGDQAKQLADIANGYIEYQDGKFSIVFSNAAFLRSLNIACAKMQRENAK